MSYLQCKKLFMSFSHKAKRITRSIALIMVSILSLCALPVKAQVPVSLMPVPRTQFFSASGTPLAGGFIYLYQAGTSVPATSYLDATGTNLATNPIQLDSGGFASVFIPAGAVDVAVFDANMVQQYKVLSVTALPSMITSLTAGYFQSSTTNPALSGFIRAASTDQICWRNNGNSADVCISKNGSDSLLFASHPFAFTDTAQTWTAPQTFATAGVIINSPGFGGVGTLQTTTLTANRIYTFPDATGTVCLVTNCPLSGNTFNNSVLTGTTQIGLTPFTLFDNTGLLVTYHGLSLPTTSGISNGMSTEPGSGVISSCSSAAPSTIVTTASIGAQQLYRFSYYLMTVGAGSGGTLTIGVSWTDEASQNHTVTSSTVDLTTAGAYQQGTVVIWPKNSSNVTYTMTASGATGFPSCNGAFVLEQF